MSQRNLVEGVSPNTTSFCSQTSNQGAKPKPNSASGTLRARQDLLSPEPSDPVTKSCNWNLPFGSTAYSGQVRLACSVQVPPAPPQSWPWFMLFCRAVRQAIKPWRTLPYKEEGTHILPRAGSTFSSSVLTYWKGDGATKGGREQKNGQQTNQASKGLMRISIAMWLSPVPGPVRPVKSTSWQSMDFEEKCLSSWSTAHQEKIKATRPTQGTAHSDGEGEAATHRDRQLRSGARGSRRSPKMAVHMSNPTPALFRAPPPSRLTSTLWKSAKISPICHPVMKTLQTGREWKIGSNQITEENG